MDWRAEDMGADEMREDGRMGGWGDERMGGEMREMVDGVGSGGSVSFVALEASSEGNME